jgi:hypothetical protein
MTFFLGSSRAPSQRASTLSVLALGVSLAVSLGTITIKDVAHSAVVEREEAGARSLASEPQTSKANIEKNAVKGDAVTRALYQSLDERAKSEAEFDRNDFLGRQKEAFEKGKLRIELGDELGGGSFQPERHSRQVRTQTIEAGDSMSSIEARLDRESKDALKESRTTKIENRSRPVRSKFESF